MSGPSNLFLAFLEFIDKIQNDKSFFVGHKVMSILCMLHLKESLIKHFMIHIYLCVDHSETELQSVYCYDVLPRVITQYKRVS